LAKRRRSTKKSATATTRERNLWEEPPGGNGGLAANGNGDGSMVALHQAAQERYLNYALSVITSRALPDVRDGLKPVQRRILYTMQQAGVTHTAKHRKCAKIVGDVMGNYHPHGDNAIYDALVRLAQPFSMRLPLIAGSGNFGSLDGDNAAAMRYTECRLSEIAGETLTEIGQQTVHFRPNYDGTRFEPVVLPSRIPNLLINGSAGIAVGMATNIPPHNLDEVCTALLKLIENPELKTHHLCKYVKAPDFPTGGEILNTAEQLKEIYKTGSGAVRVRATFEKQKPTRSGQIVHVTSIPYGVNKAVLVERIADVVLSRKVPQITDVKDVSTEDICIQLELKRDADIDKVMAYLFKHTPLQNNFNVNLTALVPTENPEVGRPEKLELRDILSHFLIFRLEVVTKRLEFELKNLEKRLHILEGFKIVFDALDEIIKIIRKSDGKADAATKIMARFKQLDAEQTDAILELKLYRLAKLEINLILEELKDKKNRAREIRKLLDEEDAAGRWAIVRDEIKAIQSKYGDARRTKVVGGDVEEVEISAEDFIVDETNQVIVSRDGWVKRQKDVRDPSTTRLREGDTVLTAQAGSTRATIVFFSNFGVAYTCRIIDIPASTGYGEPIQKLFKLKDGERVVAAFSLDPRSIGDIKAESEDYAPMSHALAVSCDGYALRFGFEGFLDVSTRSGRRYARPSKGKEIVGVERIHGSETIIAVSREARAMLCPAEQVNYLSGPGKGVRLIKLAKDDALLGFIASTGDRDLMTVETSRGGTQNISTAKYEPVNRGGRGREVMKRGQFTRIVESDIETPVLLDGDEEA